MMGYIRPLLCLLLLPLAASRQFPFGNPRTQGREGDLRNKFIDHFEGQVSWTGMYVQSELEKLYKDYGAMTVISDPRFALVEYANTHDDVTIAIDETFDTVKSAIWVQPFKRGQGRGQVFDILWFAGWKLSIAGQGYTAIEASWPTMFGIETQWHLIGDRLGAAALIDEVSSWASQIRDAVLVYEQMWWHPDYELWRSVQKASWDDVILEESFKKRLKREYRSFFKSEKLYRELGVPWKRGLIFLGPPGNGKTVSLKALMKDVGDMDIPTLYVKSLQGYDPQLAVKMAFQNARIQAPCVLVFEDLDSMINDLNRAFFLNEVDGIEDNDGLLLIGTTNHFDRLDPALSNRPSRFDRKYFFDNPTHSERMQYATYWRNKLASNPRVDYPQSLVKEVADKTDRFSFAYLKEAFVAALISLVDNASVDEKHSAFAEALLKQIKFLREELERDDPQNATIANAGSYGSGNSGERSGGPPRPGMEFNAPGPSGGMWHSGLLGHNEGVRVPFMP